MSGYVVDAVRYVDQELRAVRMGRLGEGGAPVDAHESSVAEVVAQIEADAPVHALLRDGTRARGGPRLKVVADQGGAKTLALDTAPDECLELSDLDRF